MQTACKVTGPFVSQLNAADGKVSKGVLTGKGNCCFHPVKFSMHKWNTISWYRVMLGVTSTVLQRLFPSWGRVHPKVMSQCVTRTEQNHPWNQPTHPLRDIHRAFQTRGPGKTGQMPSAYQIAKLYKVHSLFKNFKFKHTFPVRVRWLPADLEYQKPEQNTKQRYTQLCSSYIHPRALFYVESNWRHAMWWKQFSITT